MPDGELGIWKISVSTLDHVSLEGRKLGSRRCTVELRGSDGHFWIPVAQIDLLPPKEGKDGKPGKMGASVIFAMDNLIGESMTIICPRIPKQQLAVVNFTTVFATLNKRRLDNGGGLGFLFDDRENWKSGKEPWLQMTAEDTMKEGSVTLTHSTTFYLYHNPLKPAAVAGTAP